MMNDIFWDWITEWIIVVYLYNILIFTQTLEKYVRTIWQVLEVLAKYKLIIRQEYEQTLAGVRVSWT